MYGKRKTGYFGNFSTKKIKEELVERDGVWYEACWCVNDVGDRIKDWGRRCPTPNSRGYKAKMTIPNPTYSRGFCLSRRRANIALVQLVVEASLPERARENNPSVDRWRHRCTEIAYPVRPAESALIFLSWRAKFSGLISGRPLTDEYAGRVCPFNDEVGRFVDVFFLYTRRRTWSFFVCS